MQAIAVPKNNDKQSNAFVPTKENHLINKKKKKKKKEYVHSTNWMPGTPQRTETAL
jgi:hypothetical protein